MIVAVHAELAIMMGVLFFMTVIGGFAGGRERRAASGGRYVARVGQPRVAEVSLP